MIRRVAAGVFGVLAVVTFVEGVRALLASDRLDAASRRGGLRARGRAPGRFEGPSVTDGGCSDARAVARVATLSEGANPTGVSSLDVAARSPNADPPCGSLGTRRLGRLRTPRGRGGAVSRRHRRVS